MLTDLQKLYKIQSVLKSVGYKDYQRISNDILDFTNSSPTTLDSVLNDLKKEIPWEYIKGSTDFMGYDFIVNKNTLIPRIESEDFVKYAIEIINSNEPRFKTVIDIGTGSGCLIIPGYANSSLSKGSSQTRVYATDISKEALEVAKQNCKNILSKCFEKITFIETNLIEDLNKEDLEEPIFILANLPYIPTEQLNSLDSSVIHNEPLLALDGGRDGLKYYRELFDQVVEKDIQKAKILIEIEPSTLETCKSLISEKFSHSSIEVLKDFRDQERFVLICLS